MAQNHEKVGHHDSGLKKERETMRMVVPCGSAEHSSGGDVWRMLLTRIAAQDQAALGEFYDRSGSQVFGLLVRMLGDRTVAEEVALDVYLQVWKEASRFRSERGTVAAWLMTIARSRGIDRLRSKFERRREKEDCLDQTATMPAPGPDPEEATLLHDRRKKVQSALTSLQPAQRLVIEMAYFLGYSHSEIADELEEPLGTVKTRIRLGMIQLRQVLLPRRAQYER